MCCCEVHRIWLNNCQVQQLQHMSRECHSWSRKGFLLGLEKRVGTIAYTEVTWPLVHSRPVQGTGLEVSPHGLLVVPVGTPDGVVETPGADAVAVVGVEGVVVVGVVGVAVVAGLV